MTPADLRRAELYCGIYRQAPFTWVELDGKLYDPQVFFRAVVESWEEDLKGR